MAEILTEETRNAAAENRPVSPFVFPGRDAKPLTDIKRTWLSVCRKAGLADQVSESRTGKRGHTKAGKPVPIYRTTVRLHDLRHTFAAILASEGLSLPTIGALLGHTQPQTTARYAHLLDDPLRAAAERVGAYVAESETKSEVDKARQSAGG